MQGALRAQGEGAKFVQFGMYLNLCFGRQIELGFDQTERITYLCSDGLPGKTPAL